MKLDTDEDIMKAINAGGGSGGMNVDDELAALEEEVLGGGGNKSKRKNSDDELAALESEELGKKKTKRKNSDDDLAALEKEGFDDLEKKKTKKKNSDDDLAALEKEGFDDIENEEKKQNPKPQKKPEPKPKPQQQPKKPVVKEQPKQTSTNISSGVDLYPEIVEKRYHHVEKMVSLGVLEKEKALCDEIIKYKKKINKDPETWDFKKESIDDKIQSVTSYIEDGLWDFEMYKKKIREQYTWESKLLIFIEKDTSLKGGQKNKIIERVNNRKKIIEEELQRNPEQEAAEEEAKNQAEEAKKEAPASTEKKPVQSSNISTSQSSAGSKKAVDFYPEKVESQYHNVAKMESLGVLEKETGICDLIIGYKKKKGEDYDTWEMKKDNIETKKDAITSSIENGLMDFDGYKKKIKNQHIWESKLLIFVEQDKNIDEAQKKIIIQRINNRKKIIEEELAKNIDEEGGEEEANEEPKAKEQPKQKKELEVKKSLNPMFNIPKEKEAEEIKRLTEVVNDRLNEYTAAFDYFKTNELSEQQTDAIQKRKQISIEIKKIQDGKWREVNEFKLPDPVTPEYIYGYSKEERNQRFKTIIDEYKKQRDTVKEDYNARIEGLKKLNKGQFKKVEAVAKKDLEGLKAKKEKLDKILKLLIEKFQDKWVPSPLFVQSEEEIKLEKLNKDIPEYVAKVKFGKTTYKKDDRLYLIVKIPECNFEKTFNQKAPGDWSQEFDVKIEKNNFKSFYRAKILVDLYEKKTILKDRLRAKFELSPSGLKDHVEYTDNFKINLEEKKEKEDPTVEITFKVRTPCREKEYITKTRPFFQVTRIYPSFNLRGGNNNQSAIKLEVPQQNVTSSDLKLNNSTQKPSSTPTPTPKQQKPTPKQKAGGAPKKPGGPKIAVDKSEFKDEELEDPDCINCLNSLQVLEFKINKYEEIRNKIDGRTPRELMQRIIKMKCKKQTLTDALGDEIGPKDYLALLKTTFDHDKKLVAYFTQIKNAEKAKLVSERLPLIIKETEELMKQMPK